MYKLISLDLDGTLFKSGHKIDPLTLDYLEECKHQGVEIVIATGRPPRFTFTTLPESLLQGYVVCYNGGRIYHNRQLVYEQSLSEADVKYLTNSIGDFAYAVEADDVLYANKKLRQQWSGFNSKDIEDLKSFDQINKVLISNCKRLNLPRIIEEFKMFEILQTDGDRLIEIMPREISKASALLWILQELGFEMKEVVAFGDDNNDAALLKCAGLGVAMGNANECVKSIADIVTLSAEDDGVLNILEKIFKWNT